MAVPFVGLTGGLGAGKSTALGALAELGAATLSTDAVVHELLATDELRELIVERLGPEVAPDGVLDRSRIAERVFGDDEARSWLEGVLWPRVGERVASWRAGLEDADPQPRAAVVEVPLLFESGMESGFDATIAVIADEAHPRDTRWGARPRERRRAHRTPALPGGEGRSRGSRNPQRRQRRGATFGARGCS